MLSHLPFNLLPLSPELAPAEMCGADLSLSFLQTLAKTSWGGYPHFTHSRLLSQARQLEGFLCERRESSQSCDCAVHQAGLLSPFGTLLGHGEH